MGYYWDIKLHKIILKTINVLFIIIILLCSFLSLAESITPINKCISDLFTECGICTATISNFFSITENIFSGNEAASQNDEKKNPVSRRNKYSGFAGILGSLMLLGRSSLVFTLRVLLLAGALIVSHVTAARKDSQFRRQMVFYRWWKLKFITPVLKLIDAVRKDSDSGFTSMDAGSALRKCIKPAHYPGTGDARVFSLYRS